MIVDRIKQKARSWSSRFLSTAGKLVLLKSVLTAMPTYTMTCFKLPASLCKRIQSALTRFWWDSNSEKKKMCWISLKKLNKSFRDGGLGFRDIQKFNDALLAKITWRILKKPTCLLSRVLFGKYCSKSSFLHSKVPSLASHGWRSFCIGRDLLQNQLGRAIGNGETTSLWNDPWMSLSKPTIPMGLAMETSQSATVSHLISPVTRDWDLEKIRTLLPGYEEEILKLTVSKRGAEDKWVWLSNLSGEYTSKSGYHEATNQEETLLNHNTPTTPQMNNLLGFNWREEVWKLHSSSKTKLLLWKALNSALPVGENLQHRNIAHSVCCPFCGGEETTIHLFFTCRHAVQIWNAIPCQGFFDPTVISNLRQGLQQLKRLICLPPTGLSSGQLYPWIFWVIWNARNNKIFNDKQSSPTENLLLAIIRAKEWNQAQSEGKPSDPSPTLNRTKIQASTKNIPSDRIVCNTDAAWKENNSAGLGWIYSTQSGKIGSHSLSARSVSSPLMAEALAVLSAMHHALQRGFTNLHIASDSAQLIKALSSEDPVLELYGIHHDILNLSLESSFVSFNFISRNSNQATDALAKAALRSIVPNSIG